MKPKILRGACAFFLLYIFCGIAFIVSVKSDGTEALSATRNSSDCTKFDFHYLITADDRMSSNTRRIEIFMDEKAFNEENLKKLFRYLSDKNPDPNPSPNNLHLFVYTDWTQLGLPSDCPPSAHSGGDSGRDAYDYHWARFYRREGREFFRYNPVKKVWQDKDVIMKGGEIFENGAWQKPRRSS